MARGRGGKAQRGGGHSFSRDLVLDESGVAVSSERRGSARKLREEDAARGEAGSGEEISEEEESSSEEEETAAAPVPSSSGDAPLGDTAAQRAAKKAQKAQAKAKATAAAGGAKPKGDDDDEEEEDDDDLVNPNRAAPKNFKASDLSTPRELSRREREAKEKKDAQDRYWKAHAAGKTDQAKTDMARLAEIRKQREEAAAQRKAEQEAKDAEIEARKLASKQKR